MREWLYRRWKHRGCWAYGKVWWHRWTVLKWRPFHAWYSLGAGRCCARCVRLQMPQWRVDKKGGWSARWKDA